MNRRTDLDRLARGSGADPVALGPEPRHVALHLQLPTESWRSSNGPSSSRASSTTPSSWPTERTGGPPPLPWFRSATRRLERAQDPSSRGAGPPGRALPLRRGADLMERTVGSRSETSSPVVVRPGPDRPSLDGILLGRLDLRDHLVREILAASWSCLYVARSSLLSSSSALAAPRSRWMWPRTSGERNLTFAELLERELLRNAPGVQPPQSLQLLARLDEDLRHR